MNMVVIWWISIWVGGIFAVGVMIELFNVIWLATVQQRQREMPRRVPAQAKNVADA